MTERVAYIMSRFPKLTETFVLHEMLELERRGARVEVFPLLRQREAVQHAEAEALVRRARYHPFVSAATLGAALGFARRDPSGNARMWRDLLVGTWGSANFFLGALGILPKVHGMARDIERLGIQHVHAHFANHPALAALAIHRLTGIPYSFTAHGSDLHVDRRMLPEKVREAAFVLTVSRYNRDLIVDTCGEEARRKVHVAHCGVDPAAFAPGPARTAAGGGLRVACVGSLEEVKGHRFLVEALRRLAGRGVSLEGHLVGEGPLRNHLAHQIRSAGLEGQVRLRGALPRSQVIGTLADAHMAVQPSHPTAEGKREGIPVALMEAMAAELPVVASNVSGIPELVDDGVTGILVPPGDTGALADALERLAADPSLRRAMGAAGRRRVQEDFHLGRTADAVLSRIRRLQDGGHDRRGLQAPARMKAGDPEASAHPPARHRQDSTGGRAP